MEPSSAAASIELFRDGPKGKLTLKESVQFGPMPRSIIHVSTPAHVAQWRDHAGLAALTVSLLSQPEVSAIERGKPQSLPVANSRDVVTGMAATTGPG